MVAVSCGYVSLRDPGRRECRPRWQRDTIVSILVCGDARDLFFPILTQDDQWIFSIGFGRRRRPRHVIGRFNRPDRDNLQMPFLKPCGTALIYAMPASVRKMLQRPETRGPVT